MVGYRIERCLKLLNKSFDFAIILVFIVQFIFDFSVFAFLLSGFIFLKFLFLDSSFSCFARILYYFRLLKLSKYLFKIFELMNSVLKITMISKVSESKGFNRRVVGLSRN